MKDKGADDGLGSLLFFGLGGVAGILFMGLILCLLIAIFLGFLSLFFDLQITEAWQAYFADPAAEWLRQLNGHFEGDPGLTIAAFALTLTFLEFAIAAPAGLIMSRGFVNLQRSSFRKVGTGDWKAVHKKLNLLFGDDIEELALYERRILPASSNAEVQLGAPARRFWPIVGRALRSLFVMAKVLYVPLAQAVSFAIALAFFDSTKRAFEQGGALFPTIQVNGPVGASDSLGFVAASDWTIILFIALGLAVLTLTTNKTRLTFQWPVHSIRNLIIALALSAIVLKLMLPKPLLLFSAVCILSYSIMVLFWRSIARRILLRLRIA